MNVFLLLILNIVLLVTGQTLWKIGLSSVGQIGFSTLLAVVKSPYILVGLFLYVIATGIWFIILSRLELSVAYPLQSLAYVLGLVVALLVFRESIPITRWLGTAVIIFGVYLVSLK